MKLSCYNSISKVCWGFSFGLGLFVPHFAKAESWVNSRPLLNQAVTPVAQTEFPWLNSLYTLLSQSLRNPEQHRQIASIQTRAGTPSINPSQLYFMTSISHSPIEPKTKAEVTRTMQSFMEREVKTAVMPDSWKKGLNFEFGRSVNQPAEAVNRASELRYGLILTNIEPHPTPFRLASLATPEEYALVPYAPKASMQYRIGPVYPEAHESPSNYNTINEENANWTSRLPDLRFKGKIVPRGPIAANQVIPAQAIIIEQTQGFYSVELQTSKIIHRDALFHRFRLPLINGMHLRQERDLHFRANRSTLENIYAHRGLALNLDHFYLEKRYQSSLIFRKHQTTFELNAHLPSQNPDNNTLWHQQRWEFKLQTAF